MSDTTSNPTGPVPTNPMAVGALVMSISSLFFCGPAGVVGWWLGRRAEQDILASPPQQGAKIAKAAKIIGLVAVGLWVLGVVIIAVIALIAAIGGD
ncbi:DUF4190 domain-containing protein [Rhabdothermincola salaria]|uniref:DUF4190 domain-containing protein n=1 Tax=Rhabdothermincola salaria TaxID=2903142 RepID=UPI001E3B90D2|nr:hypothetical protein [Rhabdothermincola salaria]MCD9623994.1 hypothetical protein [Rhabdothermincola salaria]